MENKPQLRIRTVWYAARLVEFEKYELTMKKITIYTAWQVKEQKWLIGIF